MEALKIVQAENGNSLSAESIQAVANYLEMPSIAAAVFLSEVFVISVANLKHGCTNTRP
jgi:hypothetical protein